MTQALPKYRIGAAARRAGLSTHALRVWERRYGAVAPARTPAGDRVYSDGDVERLRRLKLLTDLGHAISQIAALDDRELASMLAAEQTAAPGDTTGTEVGTRFLAAVEALDVGEAERVLAQAAVLLGTRELVLDVLAPIFERVGGRWEREQLRISHEHAATALLRNLLGVVMRSRADARSPTAVCTTPGGELHEFGALLAALLASAHGWRALYLGPNLPAGEILHVITQSRAQMLMVSLVNDANERTRRELSALRAQLPRGFRLMAGGRAASAYADVLQGWELFGDLRAAEPYLRST